MESPIAASSLALGSLPARHARYRPHHTAVIVPGRTPGERGTRLDWRAFEAPAAQTLARQSDCLKCHAVDVKKEGPEWKDVATKYLGSVGAEDKLYQHVTTGRKAKFADGHEESHPIVKTKDPDRIGNLVNWILSLK